MTVRDDYQNDEVAAGYIRVRYSGRLGRYRWRREQRAVRRNLAVVPAEAVNVLLDCPVGTGRWLPLLTDHLVPGHVVAADVSAAMLRFVDSYSSSHTAVLCVAEQLPFGKETIDVVFCHALTKHLSPDAQRAVLTEIGRVARSHVIVSFPVIDGLSRVLWRLRRRQDVLPMTLGVIDATAAAAGLRRLSSRSCTTPLGIERSLLFEKVAFGG